MFSESGMSAGGVVSVLFLVMMIVGVAGWLFYAYLFPHSTSGQLLIRVSTKVLNIAVIRFQYGCEGD